MLKNTERTNTFKIVVKSIRDADGNKKLGLKIHKTTKDILLTFQYLRRNQTIYQINSKKPKIILLSRGSVRL